MDVEKAIIDYLKSKGIEAFADVPKPRPAEFVTVERTGGPCDSVRVDRPTVAIQAWAQSRYEASSLMYQIDSHMRDIAVGTNGIMQCKRNSLHNWPDEKQPRYQAVYDLVTQ